MKKHLLLPVAALYLAGLFSAASCESENTMVGTNDTISQGKITANSDVPVVPTNAGADMPMTTLSTKEEYLDLNSGQNTRIKQGSSGSGYTAEGGANLNIIVNTATRDTFWGPTGQLLNGYIVHSGSTWNIDEMKLERSGEGYKVKSADGEQTMNR